MKYKKYSARIEYSDADGCFVGHIAGIKDIVGFHGESVTRLRAAFEEAVDDYLEICRKTGKSPQKILFRKIDVAYSVSNTWSNCPGSRSQWKKY